MKRSISARRTSSPAPTESRSAGRSGRRSGSAHAVCSPERLSSRFSADAAVLEIQGVSAHPGWSKDVMVNAARLAGRELELSDKQTKLNEKYEQKYKQLGIYKK